jgi:hypothetical protein
MKKLMLAAGLVAMVASAAMAGEQTSGSTKNAPSGSYIKTWSQGLSRKDIQLVDQVTDSKSEGDRWMIWTAIVRNRSASRDIFSGEHLSDAKVMANVRVRMTTSESKRWAGTRSRFDSADKEAMLTVLRDDLARKH